MLDRFKYFVTLLLLFFANLALCAEYPRMGEVCITDADCFKDFEYCKTDEDEFTCEHKDLFGLNGIEIAGIFFTILILATSNSGGLGGGGSMIPIIIIFFGFGTKQAIGLSNASIAISSICRYFFNSKKSHPYKNGKGVLVDYNIASLMLPMIVVGATIGVMLNKILPIIVVTIILTILLLFVSYTTLRKYMSIKADELQRLGPFHCCRRNSSLAKVSIDQELKQVPK